MTEAIERDGVTCYWSGWLQFVDEPDPIGQWCCLNEAGKILVSTVPIRAGDSEVIKDQKKENGLNSLIAALTNPDLITSL